MQIAPLPPPPPAETIVVTGRSLAEPAAPSGVTIFDERDLRLSPATRLDQLLKQTAGFQLFRRSDSASAHPTSQGFTLRALGGNAASRALLILDGVPQADPFGGWINWPAYDPLALAEVRITRGGGSVAHGPGALAGTIVMDSAATDGLAATLEAGSRAAVEGRLLAGGEVGATRLLLSAHGARGDGFIPVAASSRGPADRAAPYRSAGGRLRLLAPLPGSAELQLNLSGFTDRRERGVQFTDNRTDGADASARLVGRSAVAWSVLAYGQWRAFESSFASVNSGRTAATRVSLQHDVPGRAAGWSAEVRPQFGPVQLRLGTDGRLMRGRSEEFASYVAGNPTRERRSGGRSGHTGIFADASTSAGPVRLNAAARIDHWRISGGFLREEILATGATPTDARHATRHGWLPTARLSAELPVDERLSLRAAAYTSWRLPTLNELFRPFRAGSDATAANPELDPERLRGAELGLEWSGGPFDLSVTAFANRLANPIANVTLGSGPGQFPGVGFVPAGGAFRQRRNLDAIRATGVEATGNWRSGLWSASLSGSFTRARVNTGGPAEPLDGFRPAQTPPVLLAASLSWEKDRRAASVAARFTGAQFEDDLNERRLSSALTFDALAAWPLTRTLQLSARAENLLDERVVAGIAENGTVERATPGTLWIGLRYSGGR